MSSATYQFPPDRQRGAIRRRASAFLVVLVVHCLLAGVLLMLTPARPHLPDEAKIFELLSFSEPKPAPAPAPKAKRAASKPSPVKPPTKPPVTPPVTPPVQPTTPTPPKLFDKLLFDAIDISKLPNRRNESAAGKTAEGTGKDSTAAYGPGEGPGGKTLYNAEWYREPTHAELAYYLPNGAPQDSWAMIACRTVEKNGVEDCQELGESPPGSGLARALRQAAWQFRVLPPRVDGRKMVGTWVRIRFDFSRAE